MANKSNKKVFVVITNNDIFNRIVDVEKLISDMNSRINFNRWAIGISYGILLTFMQFG